MAVPKKHHTKSQRNQRRMHIFLEKPALGSCPKCGKPKLPHNICLNCGYYKGREVLNVLEKLDKKERKKREKELKASDSEEKEKSAKSMTMEGLSRK